MRTGRILLVEPEEALRSCLDRELGDAGHDVASVRDEDGAAQLLEEGLHPDVVLAEFEPAERERILRKLVPDAIHLRIDRAIEKSEFEAPLGDSVRCSADPEDILRRIEEVLLAHAPRANDDDTSRCLELARRLANALPHTDSTEARIDLVTEGFEAFFGVRGTLVVRHGPAPGDWIEASQGITNVVAEGISAEIRRRWLHRSIRPFLTKICVEGVEHQVACLSVEIGEGETNLALDLSRAPAELGLREALMNLLGAAMRGASTSDRLRETEMHLDAQRSSFDGFLQMSTEFTEATRMPALCDKVLAALRRELFMKSAAIFLPRNGGKGLLELQCASGFAQARLDRIGLSVFHGLGQACMGSREIQKLSALPAEGAAARERSMLAEVGLQWGVSIGVDDRDLGLLLFGERQEESALPHWKSQILHALLGSAAVAFVNLEKMKSVKDLWAGAVQGMVAALELRCPEDRGHAERVALGALSLGRAIGLSSEELQNLALSALLHDIGKIGVLPDAEDRGTTPMRMHPVLGSQVLARSDPPPGVIQGVEQHHERYDGHGFPYGLRRDEIHVFGRILAISDAYDRMRSPEANPLSSEEALHRLELGAGLRFDPGLVAQFAGEVGRSPSSVFKHPGASPLDDVIGAR